MTTYEEGVLRMGSGRNLRVLDHRLGNGRGFFLELCDD